MMTNLDFEETDNISVCPYCGFVNRIDGFNFCEHVLCISYINDIVHHSQDFVQVADALYGLNMSESYDGTLLIDGTNVKTKKAGTIPTHGLIYGVREALRELKVEVIDDEISNCDSVEVIYCKEKLPERFVLNYQSIEEKAFALLSLIPLDCGWFVDADKSKEKYSEFFTKAIQLYGEHKQIISPVDSLLFYVNKKRRLCRQYQQKYFHAIEGLEQFEKEKFIESYQSWYNVHIH